MKKYIGIVVVVLAVVYFVSVANNYLIENTGIVSEPIQYSVPVLDSTMSKQDSVYVLISTNLKSVEHILRNSCFDCHSQNPRQPWYNSLPLVSSLIKGHQENAQKHLDMTDGFPFYARGSADHVLEEIREEIEEGEMPIFSYRIMHWGASIEGARRDSLFVWIDESRAMLGELGVSEENEEEHDDDDE